MPTPTKLLYFDKTLPKKVKYPFFANRLSDFNVSILVLILF